jgi:Tfp pilus assembly protein PilF
MRHRTLVFALGFTLLFTLPMPCLFAQSGPLDHTEILGRLAAGYGPSYVAHLVKVRGVNFSVTVDFLDRVKLAGGDGILVERLSSANPPSFVITANGERGPIQHLAKCAELIHTGDMESAHEECRAAIKENPTSPWPLLVNAKLMQYASPGETGATKEVQETDAKQKNLLREAAALGPNLAMVRQPSLFGLVSEQLEPPASAYSLEEQLDVIGGSGMIIFVPRSPEDALTTPTASNESIPADPALRRLIQMEPDLASSHVLLASEYANAHNFVMAESELREAVRLEPDNPELHVFLSDFYISQHDVESELAEFHEAARITPFGEFRVELAQALEELGRIPEAIKESQIMVAMRPADHSATGVLVRLYLEQKDRTSAIEALRSFVRASSAKFIDQAKVVDADFVELSQLAELLKENGEPDAAAEQYVFMLRYKPNDKDLRNNYGVFLMELQRLDEAIEEFNEALRLDPTMSSPHHNIGICLAAKKNVDGAIGEFQQALELNPEEHNTRIFLGAALGQKGNLKGARHEFQQAIEKNPKDADAHATVGYELGELKDTAGAIQELQIALELVPNSPAVENNLAWIYATADDPKYRDPAKALALARSAVTASPQPAFLDTLAEALLLTGRADEALAVETQAATLDPQNSELQSRLGRFREAARRASKP